MSRSNQFDWVDFYKEFAEILRTYKTNRQELTAKIRRISLTSVTNLMVPLPPLPEQQRIVDRVNELIAVCDELK